MSLLQRESKGNKRRRRERSAGLGDTKETPGVPTSLNNFPTTAVAPYWINQRLQSKMYSQTASLEAVLPTMEEGDNDVVFSVEPWAFEKSGFAPCSGLVEEKMKCCQPTAWRRKA